MSELDEANEGSPVNRNPDGEFRTLVVNEEPQDQVDVVRKQEHDTKSDKAHTHSEPTHNPVESVGLNVVGPGQLTTDNPDNKLDNSEYTPRLDIDGEEIAPETVVVKKLLVTAPGQFRLPEATEGDSAPNDRALAYDPDDEELLVARDQGT